MTVLVVLFGGAFAGVVRQSLAPAAGAAHAAGGTSTWHALLTDPVFHDAVVFSARTALEATAVAAALAVAVALALRRHGVLARWLVMLPVPVPHLLVGVMAVTWLSPGGLADRVVGTLPVSLVRDPAGFGIVAVYAYKEAPFLVLLLLAAMSPRLAAREEAAATLGAGPLARLRWVVLPSIRRPLAAGALIVAAFAFGAFDVPLVVGPTYPPTIATYALQAVQHDVVAGRAVAAAALLVAAAGAALLGTTVVRLLRDADA